jgi:hypothetical protein
MHGETFPVLWGVTLLLRIQPGRAKWGRLRKPVTPVTELSLTSARARKKRNETRFRIGSLRSLVRRLPSRACSNSFVCPATASRWPQGSFRQLWRVSPHTNGRDPRPVVELAFGEASSGGAAFCAPASRKFFFAGQSLDRLANCTARKKARGVNRKIDPSDRLAANRPETAACNVHPRTKAATIARRGEGCPAPRESDPEL